MISFFNNPRFRSFLNYLSFASPLYKWRIRSGICPSCNAKYFLSLHSSPFMTRCLGCAANITNLSLIYAIKEHQKKYEINNYWEMSTYGKTLEYLNKNINNGFQSEYYEGFKSGEIVNGILNQDVQGTSFSDSSLDLITSNQVFEHVPNDTKGFSECYRVLKRNGALIFTVPLYDLDATKMLAEVDKGKLIFYDEPEYHDSRTEGPKTALVFWHHSFNDILNRVSKAGFEVKFIEVELCKYQSHPVQVIYALKR
jgi:SAM-dependent methyltransferase